MPASAVLRSANGPECRSLASLQLVVFSGQEASGYIMFPALCADARDIQVTVKDVVLRFDYRGEPVQTADFTYRFVR